MLVFFSPFKLNGWKYAFDDENSRETLLFTISFLTLIGVQCRNVAHEHATTKTKLFLLVVVNWFCNMFFTRPLHNIAGRMAQNNHQISMRASRLFAKACKKWEKNAFEFRRQHYLLWKCVDVHRIQTIFHRKKKRHQASEGNIIWVKRKWITKYQPKNGVQWK